VHSGGSDLPLGNRRSPGSPRRGACFLPEVKPHGSEPFFEGAEQGVGALHRGYTISVPHHAVDQLPLSGNSLFRLGEVPPGSFKVDAWLSAMGHAMNALRPQR